MSIFASQFDRARVYTGMYTGRPDDTTWRTPRGAATGGGGLLAGGVVAALAAGGVVAGLAAATAIDAFFGDDSGSGADSHAHQDAPADPHHDGHPDAGSDAGSGGHADAMANAHAGADAGGDAGGAGAHGHADAWGAGWGNGWDAGWDADSSHRLAAGGHAGTVDAGHETDHLGEASGQAAHQLFAETSTAEAADDHHVHAGHEEVWTHEAGHADAGFGGDDGFSAIHDAGIHDAGS
ncbi:MULTISPECIES: hypothetical protein [Pseudofrankia]|uniref:hypothetical protein n=1 Tax=Pseudofrankia TaxID=2994363 RepID=UPI000234D946|nr:MULTISPECIES: hypothetical protein [Pseudofrankia]OHV41683.1 hypothetical protein BCD49_01830 [Pseudofrankia sp. EUN1h]